MEITFIDLTAAEDQSQRELNHNEDDLHHFGKIVKLKHELLSYLLYKLNVLLLFRGEGKQYHIRVRAPLR